MREALSFEHFVFLGRATEGGDVVTGDVEVET